MVAKTNEKSLGTNLLTLGFASFAVGGTLPVIGFFELPMWLGHNSFEFLLAINKTIIQSWEGEENTMFPVLREAKTAPKSHRIEKKLQRNRPKRTEVGSTDPFHQPNLRTILQHLSRSRRLRTSISLHFAHEPPNARSIGAPCKRSNDGRSSETIESQTSLNFRLPSEKPSDRLPTPTHPWRNWIAHRSSEPRVIGSNPIGCTSRAISNPWAAIISLFLLGFSEFVMDLGWS